MRVLAPFAFTASYPDAIGPRYTIRRRGVHLLRYTFGGSGTVARGKVLEAVKITRILR